MKIYTRTGDGGETGLFGGARVSKADARISAIGELDELNAQLGVVASLDTSGSVAERVRTIQSALFDIGAELATVPGKQEKLATAAIEPSDIELLETWIDQSEAELAPLTSFILPGGSALAAGLHLARTVARRAERALVTLHQRSDATVRREVLQYINRVSDLCFSWARDANRIAGIADIPWTSRRAKEA